MSLIIDNFVDGPKMSNDDPEIVKNIKMKCNKIRVMAIFSLTIIVLNFCITGCKNISNPIKLNVMTQQEISNRLEIQELLSSYCFAVDERDWDTYRKIFTKDAIIDDSAAGGFKSGIDEHVSFMKKALTKILIAQHQISPCLISFLNDQEAIVKTKCLCPMVLEVGGGKTHVFYQGLWYKSIVVHTADGWRIKEHIEYDYWKDNMPDGFKF